MKAVNGVGEKECTLALNFGGGAEDEENVPARIYEQPLLLQSAEMAGRSPVQRQVQGDQRWQPDEFFIC